MKKIILIGLIVIISLIVTVSAFIFNMSIDVDDRIITKFENKNLYNLTYKGVCDYKECRIRIYANQQDKDQKRFLGEYSFLTAGMSTAEKKAAMKNTFNDYFLYRMGEKEIYEGSIDLQ